MSIILSIDTDWAPDYMIDYVAQILIEANVKATWFITDQNPSLDRLRKYPELFELGIHPNFLSLSTHGQTMEEVIAHCLRIVPEAVSMRAHSLYSSTPLLHYVIDHTPLKIDSTYFLPEQHSVYPCRYQYGRKSILRVPFVWADDYEMESDGGVLFRRAPGLQVVNFHPVHIYGNSVTMNRYRRLKRDGYPKMDVTVAHRFRQTIKSGIRDLFMQLVHGLSSRPSKRLMDLLGGRK